MAIGADTYWELRATGTAGSLNGGGFNTGNANFLTDLTTDTNTGNTASPVVSSASYNFVAGDVGAKVYIKSGTNWTKGWYNIASVADNKATLEAAIGEGVNNDNGNFRANTTVGVASVGTPTNGTFGIDYSQQDTAIISGSDLACADGDTNPAILTSAGTPFGVNHVGNIIHVTAGTGYTVGWYEIVSVTAGEATLDRAVGTNGAKTNGTFYVGGAISLNSSLDDNFLAMPALGNIIFLKEGTFVLGEAIYITNNNFCIFEGYSEYRGDSPTGSNRPIIAAGAQVWTVSTNKTYKNLIYTTTAASGLVATTGSLFNCTCLNSSTSAARNAFTPVDYCCAYNSEFVSQNGYGVYLGVGGANSVFISCYFHDSDTNVYNVSVSNYAFIDCIFHAGRTGNLTIAGDHYTISNCTFHGRSSKIGTGISLSANTDNCKIIRNTFSGLVSALERSTSINKSNLQQHNNFFNNTADITNLDGHISNLAVDPQFVNVSEISGSTATSSGSVLTQAGGDFSSVVDNESYLHIISGTGITSNRGYLITSHTATTLTVNNSIGTSSAGDIVYFITVGRNFSIGQNLKAGNIVALNPSTNSYLDIGAVQRQESGGQISYSRAS